MVDVCSLALILVRTIAFVTDAASAAKENKAQCKRLAERIGLLQGPLEEVTRGQRDMAPHAVRRIQALIQDVEAHLAQFQGSERVTKLRMAINHQKVSGRFAELNHQLCELVSDLHFHTAVEALAVREVEDLKDTREDFDKLHATLEALAAQLEAQGYRNDSRDRRAEGQHREVMSALQKLRIDAPVQVVGFQEVGFESLGVDDSRTGFLGRGGFGVVVSGVFDHQLVAVKRLLEESADQKTVRAMRKELCIHAELRHPCIVQLLAACTVGPDYALVLELAPFGSVHRQLRRRPQQPPLPLSVKISMLHDAASGAAYLHKRGVIHGDLKSLNLLIFEPFKVKICDFGLSSVKCSNSRASKGRAIGTIGWMAPEVGRGNKASTASDVYSFGMVIYELLAELVPFHGMNNEQVAYAVAFNRRPQLPPEQPMPPADIIALMERCWQQEPAQRPHFDDVARAIGRLRAEFPVPRNGYAPPLRRLSLPARSVDGVPAPYREPPPRQAQQRAMAAIGLEPVEERSATAAGLDGDGGTADGGAVVVGGGGGNAVAKPLSAASVPAVVAAPLRPAATQIAALEEAAPAPARGERALPEAFVPQRAALPMHQAMAAPAATVPSIRAAPAPSAAKADVSAAGAIAAVATAAAGAVAVGGVGAGAAERMAPAGIPPRHSASPHASTTSQGAKESGGKPMASGMPPEMPALAAGGSGSGCSSPATDTARAGGTVAEAVSAAAAAPLTAIRRSSGNGRVSGGMAAPATGPRVGLSAGCRSDGGNGAGSGGQCAVGSNSSGGASSADSRPTGNGGSDCESPPPPPPPAADAPTAPVPATPPMPWLSVTEAMAILATPGRAASQKRKSFRAMFWAGRGNMPSNGGGGGGGGIFASNVGSRLSAPVSGTASAFSTSNGSGGTSSYCGGGADCEAIVAAMSAHPAVKDVQLHGCSAVASASFDNADDATRLGDAGACQAVIAAMRTFPASLAVQEQGCRAVASLAFIDVGNRQLLGQCGGCEAALAAMRAHARNRSVLDHGCKALHALAFGSPENAAQLLRLGAREVVRQAVGSASAAKSAHAHAVREWGGRVEAALKEGEPLL